MEIFKLIGSIMVDSKDAENSIAKTDEKASGLADKLSGGIKTAAKWGAGITAAATAVGGAMVAATKSTAETADTIDKASQRMKIGAESYQELAYAAELSGVEMSTMEAAAKKLEGTDLNFDDAIESIMSLTTEEERAAKAAELFGDGIAYKMTPLLNAGADGLDAMRQEARDLGLVMSGDAVKAGAELGDTFTKIEKIGASLKNSLGTALMPIVSDLAEKILDFIPMIQPLIPLISKLAQPLLGLLEKVLTPMLKLVVTVLEVIIPQVSAGLEFITEKVSAFVDKIVGAASSVKNAVSGVWNGIKNFFGFGKDTAISGSHASGLAYVPYDGYTAQLHRGETVLNSTDASNLLNEVKNIANTRSNAPTTITVISQLDGREVARSTYDYLGEIEMLRGATV